MNGIEVVTASTTQGPPPAWVVYLIVGGVIGLALLVLIIVITRRILRRKAWTALAERMGFDLKKEDNTIHERFPFDLFSAGSNRYMRNVLAGTAKGTTVTLGDYHYSTRGHQSSTSHWQTVCILENSDLDLPAMTVRPEVKITGIVGRIAGMMGVPEEEDIDFEEDTLFSDSFTLQCKDEEAARAIFDKRVRGFFAEHKEAFQGMVVETAGNAILITAIEPKMAAVVSLASGAGSPASAGSAGKCLSPSEAVKLMELAFALMDTWRTS